MNIGGVGSYGYSVNDNTYINNTQHTGSQSSAVKKSDVEPSQSNIDTTADQITLSSSAQGAEGAKESKDAKKSSQEAGIGANTNPLAEDDAPVEDGAGTEPTKGDTSPVSDGTTTPSTGDVETGDGKSAPVDGEGPETPPVNGGGPDDPGNVNGGDNTQKTQEESIDWNKFIQEYQQNEALRDAWDEAMTNIMAKRQETMAKIFQLIMDTQSACFEMMQQSMQYRAQSEDRCMKGWNMYLTGGGR